MGLTLQQICTRAATDAGVPNYLTQAGQKINLILAELAQLYDWDVLRSITTVAIVAGTNEYPLPADYLRARKLYYYINGEEFTVNQIPLEQWKELFQGAGNQMDPYWFATDLSPLANDPASPPLVELWPTPAQALTLYVMYFKAPPDYATPETSTSIPWFPYQNYLIKRLTADLMNTTADGRKGQLLSECEAWLAKYMQLSNDQEGYAVTIKKDPRRFRGNAMSARNTKTQPL